MYQYTYIYIYICIYTHTYMFTHTYIILTRLRVAILVLVLALGRRLLICLFIISSCRLFVCLLLDVLLRCPAPKSRYDHFPIQDSDSGVPISNFFRNRKYYVGLRTSRDHRLVQDSSGLSTETSGIFSRKSTVRQKGIPTTQPLIHIYIYTHVTM